MFKKSVVDRVNEFYPDAANILFTAFGHEDVAFAVSPERWNDFVAFVESMESDYYEQTLMLFVSHFTDWVNAQTVEDEEN